MSRIDRFYQAATDFRQGRSWPQIQTDVRTLWDQVGIVLFYCVHVLQVAVKRINSNWRYLKDPCLSSHPFLLLCIDHL